AMGGDGVLAGQPEEISDVDHPEAVAAASNADGGDRPGRAGAGAAALAGEDGRVSRRPADAPYRAPGRQLLDVRSPRRNIGLRAGQGRHQRARSGDAPPARAAIVHAAAAFALGTIWWRAAARLPEGAGRFRLRRTPGRGTQVDRRLANRGRTAAGLRAGNHA